MATCEPHINWMWNGFGECGKPECFFFVIETGPPPILRGFASPHECVENAVRAIRDHNRVHAIRWLQAGQAHNEAAQRCFGENQDEVLDYLLKAYGPAVPYVSDVPEHLSNSRSEEILRFIEKAEIDIGKLAIASGLIK